MKKVTSEASQMQLLVVYRRGGRFKRVQDGTVSRQTKMARFFASLLLYFLTGRAAADLQRATAHEAREAS